MWLKLKLFLDFVGEAKEKIGSRVTPGIIRAARASIHGGSTNSREQRWPRAFAFYKAGEEAGRLNNSALCRDTAEFLTRPAQLQIFTPQTLGGSK